jgi:hypothetical protein
LSFILYPCLSSFILYPLSFIRSAISSHFSILSTLKIGGLSAGKEETDKERGGKGERETTPHHRPKERQDKSNHEIHEIHETAPPR